MDERWPPAQMSAALCRLPRSAMLNSRPVRQEDGFVKQGSQKTSQAVGGGLRKEVLTLPGKDSTGEKRVGKDCCQ